jgi:AraC-like DNA-binding protein
MIVVQVIDPQLRRAVRRAAHPEEDVIVDPRLAESAIEWGFPRVIVRDVASARYPLPPSSRLLEIDEGMLRRWDADRRAEELPAARVEYVGRRIADAIADLPARSGPADRMLADLTRAAGQRLPAPLRSFGRRIVEFPYHYTTLHALADTCGTSRGALKAKFRRRALPSPAIYLRWFRIMAVADILSDPSVSVAVAARHTGFTSDGNLCRMMWTATRMTPTDVRTLKGWNRLLISFAWEHLSTQALEAWSSLEELFERRAA